MSLSLIGGEIPIFLVEPATDRSSLTPENSKANYLGIPRHRRSVSSIAAPVDTYDKQWVIEFQKRLQVSANGARLLGGRFQVIIKIISMGMTTMARSSPFSEGMKK